MPPTVSDFDPSLTANLYPPTRNSSVTVDQAQESMPKVGQTRCYWSLLSSDLHFLYLDPVLQNHLEAQADLLIGRALIDFVHPEEQTSAGRDLGGVLESRTLHGSVTRVRFSRLSRVRRELGHQGAPAPWEDADKIAVDYNYMAVDLVINWAAEGLVLCFIHAVIDIDPKADNDEKEKTGWSNWCGSPSMTSAQASALYRRLVEQVPRPPDTGRIVQVLLNKPNTPLWMSWPPDPPQGQEGRATSRDFAKLAEGIHIGDSAGDSDAKTSCTRRYKASQQLYMGPDGNREVESIFIPHGAIIFACHKVDLTPYSQPPPANGNGIGYHNANYPSHPQSLYDQPPSSFGPPPLPGSSYGYLQQQSTAHSFPTDHWAPGHNGGSSHYRDDWSPNSVSPSTSNMRSGIYVSNNQWPAQPPSYNSEVSQHRSLSPYPYPKTAGDNASEDEAGDSQVPPPRSAQRRGAARDQYGSGGRSTGKPPVGVNRCASCKIDQSPEWRKGPSGKKDLCNACGLRFARSRAKKEGVTTARRRKEKSFTVKQEQEQTPLEDSVAGSSSSGGRRGSHGDGAFLPPPSVTPAGDAYFSHKISPSSSPPSRQSMSFVHYAEQNPPRSPADARAPHFNYSQDAALNQRHNVHGNSPRTGPGSLPRLTPASFSGSRTSAVDSPMSAGGGPPTHASSFERDSGSAALRGNKRQRDHDDSPTFPASDWSRKPPPFAS